MSAPVIIMTSHDYPNIVAFNANTGAYITTELLDLSYQKDLDLPSYAEQNKLQFRGVVMKEGQITVTNGRHSDTFIASFDCNNVPGWKLDNYWAVKSDLINFIISINT